MITFDANFSGCNITTDKTYTLAQHNDKFELTIQTHSEYYRYDEDSTPYKYDEYNDVETFMVDSNLQSIVVQKKYQQMADKLLKLENFVKPLVEFLKNENAEKDLYVKLNEKLYSIDFDVEELDKLCSSTTL